MTIYRIRINRQSSEVYATFHQGRLWNLNIRESQSAIDAQGLRTIQDGLIHIQKRIRQSRHDNL
jgi:hypothetical protein